MANPKSNLVDYGTYTPDAASRDLEDSEAAGGGDFWKPKPGRTTIRILPPAVDKTSPFRVVHKHFIEVPGLGKKVSFVCPRNQSAQDKAGARTCRACARAAQLSESTNPVDYEAARNFQPSRQVLCNIIVRSSPERGPMIWAMTKGVHEKILGLRLDADAGGNFCDPEQGFDIVIERRGTGRFDTEYDVRAARGVSRLAVDNETINAWIEAAHSLDKQARIPSEGEMDDLLSGRGPSGRGGGGRVGEGPRATAALGRPASADKPRAAAKRTAAQSLDAIDVDGEVVDDDEIPFA